MQKLDIGSRWILSRLSFAAEEIDQSLADYRFNDAANSIYQFIWHELCDWYIEMVKPVLYDEAADRLPVRQCLLYILEKTLRLLHPFMPYVTEEIWQNMPHKGESIVTAEYPGKSYQRNLRLKNICPLLWKLSQASGRYGEN